MTKTTDTAIPAPQPDDADCDPIEDRLRETVRATIEALFDEELAAYLGRIRYGRGGGARKGYRHGRRERDLVGTFGTETVSVPRARIEGADGRTGKRLPLVAAARYMAAHYPTRREAEQTFDIARRLNRGENLHEAG